MICSCIDLGKTWAALANNMRKGSETPNNTLTAENHPCCG